jgi:hypothetical protein
MLRTYIYISTRHCYYIMGKKLKIKNKKETHQTFWPVTKIVFFIGLLLDGQEIIRPNHLFDVFLIFNFFLFDIV